MKFDTQKSIYCEAREFFYLISVSTVTSRLIHKNVTLDSVTGNANWVFTISLLTFH